ncbi:hypothetical protein DOTSEDRAFT_29041 [Dothistroma septosporum NZE10]|uniref:Uncharacterized protein n=1 Tax=Dothistroma septosporum (strain NZE10 / CBS 128990) TaxID=675120 RepID=M2YIY4_DOTSN|nr:hypothetical protein DOTSEDRAFT_29041 [Dothistroma septosporum NZE10]
MSSNLLSLILQAVGGIMAKAATSDQTDAQPGINAMIAGLLIQATSLGFFAAVCTTFMVRLRGSIPHQTPEKRKVRERPIFAAFMLCLATITVAIEARSI